ncbi:ADP-ribosylglycohydrolase family protein [Halomarina oriensis]|uniref:ADP-ribosylglycohydrolase family protein n=1 Tax=Halomarina oriensis TaxID=671145 RepID=A0A6B0GI49_9EURY|nr:ADP-ribosylglycohydrolase family protein [Halomarina oriensis]MWG34542.1 ADP-ribosylglycohydrolase family protein [Halomarina oriensis]
MSDDKAAGTLLGLACGDALGRPIEFMSPASIEREHGIVTEMLGYGTHGQPAGTITDDTEMALCVARSLVERGQFDPEDIARRFVEWYDSGPFDIGGMTAESIRLLKQDTPWDEAGQRVWEQSHEGGNAGNGSVMRCAPHAIAFGDDLEALERISRQSSQITHADPRCTAGCAILNTTIVGLLDGVNNPLALALADVDQIPAELVGALERISTDLGPEDLENTGYVVTTLQVGLYHGLTAESAEEAIVDAVNMGGDADTIGAVAGAVAGARFGADTLPERWLEELTCRQELTSLATTLATDRIHT